MEALGMAQRQGSICNRVGLACRRPGFQSQHRMAPESCQKRAPSQNPLLGTTRQEMKYNLGSCITSARCWG